MEKQGYIYMISISAIIAAGCKKAYSPHVIDSNNNYLVVQGVIAAGQDSTIITLSRAVNLSGTTTMNPELNATVTVVSDQNVNYPIPQIDSGKYASPPLNLDNTRKYRLQIVTAEGQTYASDYEPVKITPPIGAPPHPYLSSGVAIPVGPVKNGVCGDPPKPGYNVEVVDYFCADCRYHNHGKTVVPSFWK